MSVGIQPYEFSFTIYQGDYKQLKLLIRDANDLPIDPTTLNDVWFTAKAAPGSANAATFQKKLSVTGEIDVVAPASNGECVINIEPTDTASLAANGSSVTLTCYVKLIDGSSNPFTLRVGTLTVLPE